MPRTPLHTLIWSQDHAWYELFSFDQVLWSFVPGDEEAWQAWLEAHDSFAFQGRQGRLNVYKEARPRGGQYWYAYHMTSKRTHKCYLGRTAKVTFACLEEVAEVLTRGEPFDQTEPSFVDTTRLSFPHSAREDWQTPVPLLPLSPISCYSIIREIPHPWAQMLFDQRHVHVSVDQ